MATMLAWRADDTDVQALCLPTINSGEDSVVSGVVIVLPGFYALYIFDFRPQCVNKIVAICELEPQTYYQPR
jgi:hypothetical protein